MYKTKGLVLELLDKYKKRKDISRLILVIAFILIFMTLINAKGFWKWPTFQSMMYQFPEYGTMAFGVALAMMTGGIDLSVVGIANVSSMVSAICLLGLIPMEGATATQQITGIAVAIIAAVSVGILSGFLNGFLITKTKIPPMLATIGTYYMLSGLALIISGAKSVSGMPAVFTNIFTWKLFGIVPTTTLIFLLVIFAMWLIMERTTFGIKVHMIGSNMVASNFSGLKTTRILFSTYIISGILSAIAGLIMLANYNSAKAGYGEAYTLQCILIAVLGGVNPLGGKGSVGGIALAVITLQILSTVLNMFTWINSFYKPMIWGAVLLVVLFMNLLSDNKEKRKARS
ncbi:MAG: ABC transporter permease [Eubacteriales bacterium]|nr:ABC transporter permease [Eubacteriales bacterium]